jgi:glucosyl-3-phosphoglycerate synthase
MGHGSPDPSRMGVTRTFGPGAWTTAQALSVKSEARISVVLPALNEEATVGQIVAALRRDLVDAVPLVDQILVLDSGSTDATATVARAAGATVVHRDDVLTDLPAHPGKGEAMWRSLMAVDGDLVVFLDADLREFRSEIVAALVGPLLADESIALVKGFYDRPLRGLDGEVAVPHGGGRVTELVARPLLAMHWPELAGVVQPLAGEYAARRSLLERLPFACGYGVELGMLIDTARIAGVDAIAQSDLGERHHRHQDVRALGRMAAELWQVALDRLDRDGQVVMVSEPSTVLTQYGGSGRSRYEATTHDVALRQRPPISTVEAYRDRRRRAVPVTN